MPTRADVSYIYYETKNYSYPKGTGIERVSLSNLTIYVVPMILVPRSAGGNGMPLLLSRSRKNARLPGAGQSRHRPHCAHGPNRVPL